jgi:hypothetical protein
MGRAARRVGVGLAVALGLLAAGAGWLALRHLPLWEDRAPERLDRAPTAAHRPAPRRVVLISVDGLAPRVLDDTPTPTLARLAREGRRAEVAHTVVPSITMTSHVSMLSGVPPAVHGVTFNRYQPWSRIPVPTLFTQCAREGLRCGLFAGKRKFAHLAEHEPGVARYAYAPAAAEVLAAASRWSAEAASDLLVVHLAEVDLAGHRAGWGSAVQKAALTGLDTLLGAFLARVCQASRRPVAVLLTSDHGGHGTRHGSAREEDRRIPWILWGDGIEPATLGAVSTLDTAPTLAALLGVPAVPAWAGTARVAPAAVRRAAPARCAGAAADRTGG